MKLIYAKLWLKKYIRYNYSKYDNKTFNHKLNWEIVNLSHRVYKIHGINGHNKRQRIRKQLWTYSKMELSRYRPSPFRRFINYLKKVIKGV